MSLEECVNVKDLLSDSLLVPGIVSDIFGIGVGIERKCDFVRKVVLAAEYHVRIYASSNFDQHQRVLLSEALKMPVPNGFPFEAAINLREASPIGKASLPVKFKHVVAPRPRFASEIPVHKDSCYNINNSTLNEVEAGIGEMSLASQDIYPGISITCAGMAGTLGYFVRKNGQNYLLSNSHVIAAFGDASGPLDVEFNSQIIANVSNPADFKIEFGKTIMKNGKNAYFPYTRDAAIALLDPNLKPRIEIVNRYPANTKILQSFVAKKNGRTNPEKSMFVSKHGAKTCETGGWIDDVDCDFMLDNDNDSGIKYAKFVKQFRVIRTTDSNVSIDGKNSSFASGGDSGSLVFDNDRSITPWKHRAIGLLFAVGSDMAFSKITRDPTKNTRDYAVVTPISEIQTKLGVTLLCDLPNQQTTST
jgi:hypothetical protein